MMQRILVLATASLMLMGMSLPDSGPRPQEKPSTSDEARTAEPIKDTESKAAAETKTGAASAEAAQDAATGKSSGADAAGSADKNVKTPGIPVPAEKPEDAPPSATPEAEKPSQTGAAPESDKTPEQSSKPETEKDATQSAKDASPAPPPIVHEDPQKLEACLRDLKALGAEFESLAPVTDEQNGCGIEKPIALSQVLPGIPLDDKNPMRCEAALSLARWMKGMVEPSLKIALPERRIVGISNASSYVCRLRNHAETGKISEHARGNAIDIAGFKLDNGETITMTPKEEDSTMTGAFQRTATAGACLYFTTVLSPGSDATHQDHLHIDVMERKGGYRYCR